VCPSFIATGIDRNALGPDGRAVRHAQVVVGRQLQPDAVAARIFHGCERSERLLLIGRTARPPGGSAAWRRPCMSESWRGSCAASW